MLDARRPYGRFVDDDQWQTPPTQFITPDSMETRSLREMWDQVILSSREAEVVQAMRILEPSIESIVFLTGDTHRRVGGRGGIVASTKQQSERFPLGSYGDGMRRLLALSLSLIRCANGYLFIDEIDTGVHHSIMADMWKLVIKTSRQSDIQVFATTHSLDCLRGLAYAGETEPALLDDVVVHKIEKDLDHNIAFRSSQISIAVHREIEVRG